MARSFIDAQDKVISRYPEGRYLQALALAQQCRLDFPDRASRAAMPPRPEPS